MTAAQLIFYYADTDLFAGCVGGEGAVVARVAEHLGQIVLAIGDGHVGDVAVLVGHGGVDGVDKSAIGSYVELGVAVKHFFVKRGVDLYGLCRGKGGSGLSARPDHTARIGRRRLPPEVRREL